MRGFIFFLWSGLFVAAGYALFHISFLAVDLEDQLAELNREILEEQESVHVLNAEWTYLNRPSRIETLSDALLPELNHVRPTQVMHMEALPLRRVPEGEGGDEIGKGPVTKFIDGFAEAIPTNWRRASE